jgi:RimJ/RimL family protein N-acetyltransferase
MENKDIEIIPYCVVDGIPLLRDSQITGLIDRAKKDGTLSAIFYGDSKYTKYDFLEKVKYLGNCRLYVARYGEEIAGFVLLDEIRWRHAHGHFCVFSEFWGKRILTEISHAMLRYLFGEGFSVLIGTVPVDNEHALRFTERTLGMKKLAIIPEYFHNDSINDDVDGVMFIIEKGDMP